MTLLEFIKASKQISVQEEIDGKAELLRTHQMSQLDALQLSSALALMRHVADKISN
jgi:hypothetical protein